MVRDSTKILFAEPKSAAQPFTNVISHAIRTRDFYFGTRVYIEFVSDFRMLTKHFGGIVDINNLFQNLQAQ